jgi:hypothetical protein
MPPAGSGGAFLPQRAAAQGGSLLFPTWYGLAMSIVNRRNAVVGWITVKMAKRVAKKKATDVAMDPKTGGVIAGLTAALGAVLLQRKRRSGDGSE